MTYLKFTFLFIIIFTGCSPDDESPQSTISDDLTRFANNYQTFTMNPDSTTIIQGQEGTTISIPPHSFIKKDGSRPDSVIQLELKEIYSKSEMIYNGLSTTSNDRLLESGGMLFLNAMSGKDSLALEKSLEIRMPNKFQIPEGKYFKGEYDQQAKRVNWVLGQQSYDTTITRIITLSYGSDSVILQKLRISGSDTTILLDSGYLKYNNVPSDYYGDTVAYEEVQLSEYNFLNINTLGWINCDRFYNIKNPSTLKLNYTGKQHLNGYLVFQNTSSVIYLNINKGIREIDPLPPNEIVTVLLFSKSNDQYSMFKKKVKLDGVTELNIKLKSATLKAIQRTINDLDK